MRGGGHPGAMTFTAGVARDLPLLRYVLAARPEHDPTP